MNKYVLIILFLGAFSISYSQAMYRMYPSKVLEEERQVKILKPRNYSKNPDKKSV